jgi:hypothetical protein
MVQKRQGLNISCIKEIVVYLNEHLKKGKYLWQILKL